MKSVIICGSIFAAAETILDIKKKLEKKGLKVEIPWGVKRYEANNFVHTREDESAKLKKEQDLIRRYFKLMRNYDAVLVMNTQKHGIPGYIGGNTFLEMGFAHVLNKPLYVFNPLPSKCPYLSEIEAMDPIVINGDLDKLK